MFIPVHSWLKSESRNPKQIRNPKSPMLNPQLPNIRGTKDEHEDEHESFLPSAFLLPCFSADYEHRGFRGSRLSPRSTKSTKGNGTSVPGFDSCDSCDSWWLGTWDGGTILLVLLLLIVIVIVIPPPREWAIQRCRIRQRLDFRLLPSPRHPVHPVNPVLNPFRNDPDSHKR